MENQIGALCLKVSCHQIIGCRRNPNHHLKLSEIHNHYNDIIPSKDFNSHEVQILKNYLTSKPIPFNTYTSDRVVDLVNKKFNCKISIED